MRSLPSLATRLFMSNPSIRRNAGDERTIEFEPVPGQPQQAIGITKVLENIAADDRVKPAGRKRQVQRVDIPDKDLVKPRRPPPRHARQAQHPRPRPADEP